MLDVRRLRTLQQLSSAGSFSGAAEALGYTQSAVSQQIAALEHDTGLQLVQRGRRPAALTAAGRTLLESAEPIFGQIAKAEATVGELAGRRARRLRVAAFPSACSTLLAPAIAAVRREHPDTELSVMEAEPDDAAAQLIAGEVDLAVAYTYPGLEQPDHPVLEQTTLCDEALLLVVPTGHRLLARPRLLLRHLASEVWIVPPADGPSSSYRLMLTRACREAGFQPRIAFEIEDTRAAQALVAEGLGLALLPGLALSPMAPSVQTRKPGDAPLRRIFVWSLAGPSSPAAESMRQALHNPVEQLQATTR